jgi:hypothetical protein
MGHPPRPPSARLIDRPLFVRAWLWLGLVEAVPVLAAMAPTVWRVNEPRRAARRRRAA